MPGDFGPRLDEVLDIRILNYCVLFGMEADSASSLSWIYLGGACNRSIISDAYLLMKMVLLDVDGCSLIVLVR